MLSSTAAHSIILIVIMTLGTMATRFTPFLLFGGKKGAPAIITYLGNMLPPAIMAMLVVYCFKNVNLFAGSHGLPEAIASLAIIILHTWKRNTLISIAGGTIFYMVLVQIVF